MSTDTITVGNDEELRSSLKLKAILLVVSFFFGVSLLVGLFLFSGRSRIADAGIAEQERLLKNLSVWALWTTLICLVVGVISVITIVGPAIMMWLWGLTMAILAVAQVVFAVLLAIKLS